MELSKDEIAELERIVEYLNETWKGDIEFKLVQSINNLTWYIYPEFLEDNE